MALPLDPVTSVVHLGIDDFALQKGMKVKEAGKPEILEVPSLSLATNDGQPYSAHQAERYDRYQQAITLLKQGMIVKEIAKLNRSLAQVLDNLM